MNFSGFWMPDTLLGEICEVLCHNNTSGPTTLVLVYIKTLMICSSTPASFHENYFALGISEHYQYVIANSAWGSSVHFIASSWTNFESHFEFLFRF